MEHGNNKGEEPAKDNIQEKAHQSMTSEHEFNIPPVDSAQWSNITIRKKAKKKSYKFWQTPNNGIDMFSPMKEVTKSVLGTRILTPEVTNTLYEEKTIWNDLGDNPNKGK